MLAQCSPVLIRIVMKTLYENLMPTGMAHRIQNTIDVLIWQ
jgi:hypothetical protein